MRFLNKKRMQKIASILTIGIVISSTPLAFLILNVNNSKLSTSSLENSIKPQGIVQDQYTVQWLDNPTFESPVDPWYNTTQGDSSDVNATIGTNQANYEILGEQNEYDFYSDLTQDSNWNKSKNPNFPAYPDTALINGSGASVSHYWDETADQSVAVNWNRILTMPVNMSDYEITSADVTAIFNASVQATPSIDNNGAEEFTGAIDTLSDAGVDTDPTGGYFQGSTGDYVRFYVWISDPANNSIFEIAYNQTTNLGQDSPLIDHIDDTVMVTIPENILLFYLTSVLNYDFKHFRISIGMRIWCEDNFGQDADNWRLLIIKSVDLQFTYEKKINQFTSLSWNQIGNKITGANVDIVNATVNFKYKINQVWPTSKSPNSEIRVFINNRLHSEARKLENASLTFEDIKDGGFDVTNLILKDQNISISIQVYLADEFSLDQKIIVSITNVTLDISYVVNIIEDTTSLSLFLKSQDKTLEKSIEVKWGTKVNVTVVYKDSLSNYIPEAKVQLNPQTDPVNLTENLLLQQYNITLDTRDMVLGNNYFQLSAEKRYYERILILFNIKVLERDTDIKLFLNEQDKTLDKSIQMIYGNDGNITITYQDIENIPATYIDGATVQLEGIGAPRNLIPILNHYSIFVNTAELGLGNSFLTVIAQKENSTTQSIRFKIEVLERNSYIDKINLNGIEQTTIELQWSENLNIGITYNDTGTGTFIPGATVQLSGTGISESLAENVGDYSLDINTNQLKIGVNFLTISAFKENYTLASRIVSISVTERSTYIDEVLLNQRDRTENKTITITAGELLNVTFKYKDSTTNNPITGAEASIQSSYYSDNLTENLLTNQYSIEFNSSILGVGAKFLNIIASLENHTIASEVLTIFIVERGSILDVKLNGTAYPNNYITVEVWQTINITVTFKDLITTNHLTNATIDLLGFGEFIEEETKQQYTYIVDAADLDQGIDIINVVATKSGYLSQAAQITIEITERKTRLGLFLNNVNNTDDPYLEVPIGASVNFSISYIDSNDLFVSGATVNLIGEGLDASLIEDPTNEIYSFNLNTKQSLDIGVRILTIVAQRNNYQIQTIDIRLDVRRIRTNITSSTGTNVINTTPGNQITLSVILDDLDFNKPVLNATVSYSWEGGSGILTDSNKDGVYETTVPNIPLGSHTFTISAYAGDDYDFERYEITVTAVQSPIERGLFIALLTLALIAAGALGAYIILYQTYLKYPKAVRKVRKYRKTLNKEKDPNVDIVSRESATKHSYHSEYDKSSKLLKGKPVPKQSLEPTDIKKTPIEK